MDKRRRAGFRLETSYRFRRHGTRRGRQDARVADSAGLLATLTYGDSATVRITNVGRLRAKDNEPPGYWLDPADGRWMNERDASDASGDSGELPVIDEDGKEKRRKKRVIPFVEDRRNILVVTLDEPLPEPVALTVMYALERGIETAFELEDSELTSELLPPADGPHDRLLFTEAAEGGAGVLRRLQAEPRALAKAARQALAICHFDGDGEDEEGPHPDRPCARGCYECLLTYGNQLHHGVIDRRLIVALLLRLASAEVTSERRGETTTDQHRRLVAASVPAAITSEAAPATSVETEFLTWLREHGLRLPDEAGTTVPEADARPDFVYRMPGVNLAVFLGSADGEEDAARDEEAEERLYLARWDVIRFPEGSDWDAIAAEHARYFGLGPSS
ncbi:DUF1998 domain-containing protein [Streptomyces sp. A5-4]|uniref:DUF1998 domain-containing protein n=1 Tax=Streptomyces sp. A5-4 TaxID=3384771 RepID=UPI003DAA0CBD